MAHAKQASKRKRQRIVLPILGAAGASLAMGGASATVPTANLPSQDKAPLPVITLDEEEIFDVNLATFYVFDKENDGTSQLAEKWQHEGAEAAEAAQHEAAEAAQREAAEVAP